MSIDVFQAIEMHSLRQLAVLLEHGSDPNQIRSSFVRLRPLHAAVIAAETGGTLDLIKLLLSHGADINQTYPDIGGATPLLCSLFNDQLEAARLLLDSGADPNIRGDEGDSALRWSVEVGNHEMAALLLSKGAWRTMDESGPIEGRTALGMAVHRLDAEMVGMLLAAGANPSRRDLDRRTAQENLPPRQADNAEDWRRVSEILSRWPQSR